MQSLRNRYELNQVQKFLNMTFSLLTIFFEQLAENLGLKGDNRVLEALRLDDAELTLYLKQAIRMKSVRNSVRAFRGELARSFLDISHRVSHSRHRSLWQPSLINQFNQILLASPMPDDTIFTRSFRRKLRRVVVRLAQDSDTLPLSLQVEGVALSDRDCVGGGAFADVFKGVLNGGDVAVKRMRIFIVTNDDDKAKTRRVQRIIRIPFRHC